MKVSSQSVITAVSVFAIVIAVSLFATNMAQAASDTNTQTQTLTATINSAANLTLATDTVTFQPHNPAAMASIAADENGSTVTASATTDSASTVTLTVEANTDLTSGDYTIAADNVTFTSTGTGYVDGTLSSADPVAVGSWTGPGVHVGTMSFFLANSFDYNIGTYTATLTYTLVAP